MIKDQNAFPGAGRFYKGNLHSHTTHSDGKLSCREAAQLYREHGYSFLCFSEHDFYTDMRDELDREDFIILPGLEASAVLWEETGNRRQKVHHIHGILGTEAMQKAAGEKAFRGSERVPAWEYRGRWDGAAVAQEITDYVRSRGCIAMYNHPLWSRVEPEEYEHTQGLWGIEVFNYNTVNESGNGYDPASWDRMLHRGVRIWGTATDDNHNEGLFPDDCGGWIMVKAEVLSHEAILQGMLQGRFYGSSGPELYRWEIKNGVAAVECSPAARIDFIVGNHVGDGKTVLAPEGRTVVYAEYPLKGDEIFIRVQCTDQAGRAAWSNPFFAEQG